MTDYVEDYDSDENDYRVVVVGGDYGDSDETDTYEWIDYKAATLPKAGRLGSRTGKSERQVRKANRKRSRKNHKKGKKPKRKSHRGHKATKAIEPCAPQKAGNCVAFAATAERLFCDGKRDYCKDDCDCPGYQKCCPNSCGRNECLVPTVSPTEEPPTTSSSTTTTVAPEIEPIVTSEVYARQF